MSRISLALLVSVALAGGALGGCAPIIRYQGYTALEQNPAGAEVGADTKSSVQTKFGTPTAVSTFDPNIWYYMAQVTDQFGAYRPQVRQRQIVQITFDAENEQVAEVKNYTAADGRTIAYSDRETPTIGRELGIIEQLLGNIGATTALPREDEDPGNLPGGIGR